MPTMPPSPKATGASIARAHELGWPTPVRQKARPGAASRYVRYGRGAAASVVFPSTMSTTLATGCVLPLSRDLRLPRLDGLPLARRTLDWAAVEVWWRKRPRVLGEPVDDPAIPTGWPAASPSPAAVPGAASIHAVIADSPVLTKKRRVSIIILHPDLARFSGTSIRAAHAARILVAGPRMVCEEAHMTLNNRRRSPR